MTGSGRTVLPTRAELLAIRRKIVLAEKAHRLLKIRRDALLLDLVKRARTLRPRYDQMEARYRNAEKELMAALIMAGTAGVTLAAFSVEEHPSVAVEYQNLVGLPLPRFHPVNVAKSLDERGYGLLGTSSVIDDAADACEGMVEEIITMAEVRTQVLLLLREIGILTRRVNALEKMLLPDLKARERTIGSIRDEREREEFNRLFLIKRKKNRTG